MDLRSLYMQYSIRAWPDPQCRSRTNAALDNDKQWIAVKGQLIGIFSAVFAGPCVRAVYDLAVSAAGQRRLQRRHGLGIAFQRRVDGGVVAIEVLHHDAVRLFPLGQLKIGCFVHR